MATISSTFKKKWRLSHPFLFQLFGKKQKYAALFAEKQQGSSKKPGWVFRSSQHINIRQKTADCSANRQRRLAELFIQKHRLQPESSMIVYIMREEVLFHFLY